MENREDNIKNCILLFQEYRDRFAIFEQQVCAFFKNSKILNSSPFPLIHSYKSRLKDLSHLEDKLNRKWEKGEFVTPENFFQEITDLCGVRVLHLSHEQFPSIHQEIMRNITDYKDWVLHETPKAYIWDKEKEDIYRELGLNVQTKDSNYTSMHYVVRPNKDSFISCEIQVRTLFEEVWGEIDHEINYPHKTDSIACKEQIKVLSKLVNTGSRLADAIFITHNDYNNSRKK